MSDTAYQEKVLAAVLTRLGTLQDGSNAAFKQTDRGRPLFGNIDKSKLPAVFVEQAGLRPEVTNQLYEEMEETLLFFNVVIVGSVTDESRKGAQLNRLEALVYEDLSASMKLDGLGGLLSLLLRKGVDGPLHMAGFTMGVIQSLYAGGYEHERGLPFVS